MKDNRTYDNEKLKYKAFLRGYNDGKNYGRYSTNKAVSWQSVGNDAAIHGMSELEAEKYFKSEFLKGGCH